MKQSKAPKGKRPPIHQHRTTEWNKLQPEIEHKMHSSHDMHDGEIWLPTRVTHARRRRHDTKSYNKRRFRFSIVAETSRGNSTRRENSLLPHSQADLSKPGDPPHTSTNLNSAKTRMLRAKKIAETVSAASANPVNLQLRNSSTAVMDSVCSTNSHEIDNADHVNPQRPTRTWSPTTTKQSSIKPYGPVSVIFHFTQQWDGRQSLQKISPWKRSKRLVWTWDTGQSKRSWLDCDAPTRDPRFGKETSKEHHMQVGRDDEHQHACARGPSQSTSHHGGRTMRQTPSASCWSHSHKYMAEMRSRIRRH